MMINDDMGRQQTWGPPGKIWMVFHNTCERYNPLNIEKQCLSFTHYHALEGSFFNTILIKN